jgi:hypothetical protein
MKITNDLDLLDTLESVISLEKLEYSHFGGLKESVDLMQDLEQNITGYSYICDAIAELSDSWVSIYNNDLWKDAYKFKRYTEEAIENGLVSTESDCSMEKMFMAGQYEYYIQAAYNNESELYYNVMLNIIKNIDISEYKIKHDSAESTAANDKLDELIEYYRDDIDHNCLCDIFKDKANEVVADFIKWIKETAK